MKSLVFIAATIAATLFYFNGSAQKIANAKTQNITVYGNCGMCEKTIEKAALQKGIAQADWDQDTKIAQITFDSTKTTSDDILQRIAAAGYDSDKFRAPDAVYEGLHACCHYDRPQKAEAAAPAPAVEPAPAPVSAPAPAAMTGMTKKKATSSVQQKQPLSAVYTAYFGLKDALVASDATTAGTQATALLGAIDLVKMEDFTSEQHTVWMKYLPKLRKSTEKIKGTSDLEQQRQFFIALSDNMYAVMKAVKPDGETYLEHCPMANEGKGANWLSREKNIKNPYYGQSMLTCGKVTEIIR